jgi:hypothetical protein
MRDVDEFDMATAKKLFMRVGVNPRRWMQVVSRTMSQRGAWQTISASTRTPVSLT